MMKIENLISDPGFINWANNRNEKDKWFWDEWIRNHPEEEETIEIARAMVLGIEFNKETTLTAAEIKPRFDELSHRIQAEERQKALPMPARRAFYRIAAMFVLLAAIGFIVRGFVGGNNQHTYTTGYGEITDITLPDGSVVTLNANSKLTVRNDWSRAPRREVWLEGEAYFQVLKQQTGDRENTGQAPYIKFVVHASGIDVEVIGTRFNVYNRRGTTKVVLASGKVKLARIDRADTIQTVMQPGELVKISGALNAFDKQTINAEDYIAWTEHRLVFDNTPLSEIVPVFEDNFGLEVTLLDDSLAGRKLTGEITIQDPGDLINALTKALNINILRSGDKLIVDSNTPSK